MKIHLKRIKANVKFHGKNTGFVDSGFVKTWDELVIGQEICHMWLRKLWHQWHYWCHNFLSHMWHMTYVPHIIYDLSHVVEEVVTSMTSLMSQLPQPHVTNDICATYFIWFITCGWGSCDINDIIDVTTPSATCDTWHMNHISGMCQSLKIWGGVQ